MFCNNCGKPLPSKGAVCAFCGAMMDKEQIENNKKINEEKNNNQVELLSEKYGYQNNFEYRDDNKEHKLIGIIIISIIVLFIIILAILLNV